MLRYSAYCYIFLYLFYIISKSSNLPIMDDYTAILNFLNECKNSNLLHLLSLLFRPHNEHFIIPVKIITLIYYKIYGDINFASLILISQIFLLGIYFIFQISLQKNYNNKISIPIVFLLFNLCGGTILIWPMAAITHFSTIFFAVSSLYLFNNLDKKYNSFILPISIFFGVFSSGSGILLIPVLLLNSFLTRSSRLLKTATFYSLIIVLLYFLAKCHNDAVKTKNIFNILISIKFFFIFLGNSFSSVSPTSLKPLLSMIVGVMMCLAILYATVRKTYLQQPVLYFSALYVVFIAAAAAYARSGIYGSHYALEWKYQIYGCFLLACILCLCLDVRVITNYIIVWSICILICASSWISNAKEIKSLSQANWIIFPLPHDLPKQILEKAKDNNIYNYSRYMGNAD